MTKCPQCRWRDDLPAPSMLTVREGPTHAVYAALLAGDATQAALREVAGGGPRSPESLVTLIYRLERRLAVYGIAIARIGAGGDACVYRLVPR